MMTEKLHSATTGTSQVDASEETLVASNINATVVRPLMHIRVPIATVCPPQDSVLGISSPLPLVFKTIV